MVVFEDGQAAKAEYRRFKIRYNPEQPDDFAMMKETIMRRLAAYRDGNPKFAKLPDLMVIDGGRGQLGAALKAMQEIGIEVPAIGLAKKRELIFVPQPACDFEPLNPDDDTALTSPNPIELPMTSPGLILLRRLRDEAHLKANRLTMPGGGVEGLEEAVVGEFERATRDHVLNRPVN